MNFDQAFTKLIGHEGGYSNHPADKGGPTNFGVTEKVARANGYMGDMRDFTVAQSKVIYRKNYWDSIKADDLPPECRYDVFDGAVNSGVSQSTKWLQRALNVPADGILGNVTLTAARFIPGYITAARYNGYRLLFMTDLPNWDSFSEGWAKRIASNLKEA